MQSKGGLTAFFVGNVRNILYGNCTQVAVLNRCFTYETIGIHVAAYIGGWKLSFRHGTGAHVEYFPFQCVQYVKQAGMLRCDNSSGTWSRLSLVESGSVVG